MNQIELGKLVLYQPQVEVYSGIPLYVGRIVDSLRQKDLIAVVRPTDSRRDKPIDLLDLSDHIVWHPPSGLLEGRLQVSEYFRQSPGLFNRLFSWTVIEELDKGIEVLEDAVRSYRPIPEQELKILVKQFGVDVSPHLVQG